MKSIGKKNAEFTTDKIGIKDVKCYWNLSPAALIERTISSGQGKLTDTGALSVDTGKFTGRSPKDRFIVKDDYTEKNVFWSDVNMAISQEHYQKLKTKVLGHLNKCEELYIRDALLARIPSIN